MRTESGRTREPRLPILTAFLRRRSAEFRHDDRLRVGRQVSRPQTSFVALINGGRGPA